MTQLSSETVHATTVCRSGRAVMLAGPSGSGKSDLALQLIDRDFKLVADDQTLLSVDEGRVIATAPPSISGKMEVRGLGIVELPVKENVPVCLFVSLGEQPERLPEGETESFFGIEIPRIRLAGSSPSAAIRVDMALDRLGLEEK
ncbi:HPr kinase/phosphorylase [Sphingomicrobium clamense]|uniref:Aldolase n=1 Tax=Sphingomicrobium clamense TaxID=2851013 RepID=A0ABS6V5X1_9SPHN|nr:aldolase [Sphingomicrobium sp. B8]MBW0144966.1 aldolase [Sphingomicrobium sp. B8]